MMRVDLKVKSCRVEFLSEGSGCPTKKIIKALSDNHYREKIIGYFVELEDGQGIFRQRTVRVRP